MTLSHNSGATPFGPVNGLAGTGVRSYLHSLPAFPNADWSIGIQYRTDIRRGNLGEFLFANSGLAGGPGSGGSDYYIQIGSAEDAVNATYKNHVVWRIANTGAQVTATNGPFVGTTTLVPGQPYWSVLQRRSTTATCNIVTATSTVTITAPNLSIRPGQLVQGTSVTAGTTVLTYDGNLTLTVSNSLTLVSEVLTFTGIEMWTSPVGGTPVLEACQAWNTAFTTKTLSAGEIGYNFRGLIGEFFHGQQSLSATDMQNLANGTDPSSIISSGNQKSALSFNSAGNTLTNGWTGGNTATANGTWTNVPTAGPLAANSANNVLLLTEKKQGYVIPTAATPGAVSQTISGTYSGSGYTPTGIQYQINKTSDLSVVQSWASLTSFTASGGAWSGVASFPEGGTFFRAVRDMVTTTITYQSANYFSVCPMVVTMGQSPIVFMDASYLGATSLTGITHGWYTNTLVSEPYGGVRATAECGPGMASWANQYGSDASGQPLGIVGTAIIGTSISDWSGSQVPTMSASTAYTAGETVNILNGASLVGTATVVSSVGTLLTLKYSTAYGSNGFTITGLTSGTSLTVSSAGASGINSATTYVPMLSAIDGMGLSNCPITIYWLNGASDAGNTGNWAGWADILLSRLAIDLTTNRGITFRFVLIPSNRDTQNAGDAIRNVQWNWAIARNDYNSTVFIGPSLQDWQTTTEQIGKFVQTSASNTTTAIVMDSTQDGVANAVGGISITTGTNSGQLRSNTVQTATFLTASKNITLSAANPYIIVGQQVTGTGIAANTTVSTVAGTAVTVNNNTTAPGTAVALTFTAITAYNSTTKVLTLAAGCALPGACDNTSKYNSYENSAYPSLGIAGGDPHPSRVGCNLAGIRLGRDTAWRYGKVATNAYGPTIKRATLPPGTNGTVIDVQMAHAIQGLSLQSANATPSTLYGWTVSNNSFASLLTISTIQIIRSDTVRLTLSAAPGITGLQIKFMAGHPIDPPDVARINDVIMDTSTFNNGNPVWFTPSPISVTYDYAAACI